MRVAGRLLSALVATFVVVLALGLLSPARQISGDTVPGRMGALAMRCGAGFDLARIDWIRAASDEDRLPYWARRTRDGQVVSTFGPAPAVVGALALFDVGTTDTIDDSWLRRRERIAAACMVALAAALLTLAAAARRRLLVSIAIGVLAGASFAGAATLGQGLWQQTVALPFVVAGLALIAWRERTPRAMFAAPACLLLATMLRPAVVPLTLGLGIAWCLARPRRKTWMLATGAAALAIVPLVAWNIAYLGSPFPTGQATANAELTGHLFVFSRAQLGYGLGGLLLSPGRGLLWFAPIVGVGLVRALRSGSTTDKAIAYAIAATVVTMALFYRWWGGICFGPRLLDEAVWVGIWLALGAEVQVSRFERAITAIAIAVTLVVGQLGLWGWRAEQWETRRNPDVDDSAVWDFVDSPVLATLRSTDDEVFAVDAVDEPPRTRCDHGNLRSLR